MFIGTFHIHTPTKKNISIPSQLKTSAPNTKKKKAPTKKKSVDNLNTRIDTNLEKETMYI